VLKVDGIRIFFRKILSGLQMLSNIEVIYAIGYMGFAVLGLALHYFFFSYHLIMFIRTQPVLKNVLKAVYNPRQQLGFIFAFFILLEYFYSLIIYYFFYDIMPKNSCDSVFICLATIYQSTFMVSMFINLVFW
jgi:inositol 1,4,5-triphosphate receptor type 1